jgi:hypothetical protein
MVVALRTVLRQHIAELISKAYSTVTVATATALLGFTRDELLCGACSAGAQCCIKCLIVHGRMCSHDIALALWIGTWHLILARVQIDLHVVSRTFSFAECDALHWMLDEQRDVLRVGRGKQKRPSEMDSSMLSSITQQMVSLTS